MNQFEEHNTQEDTTQEAPVQHDPFTETNEVEEHGTPKNMIIVAVLAIVVVVLALMYMWGASIEDERMEDQVPVATEPIIVAENEEEETSPQLTESDELEAIEADLDTTSTADLDAELIELEAELDAALQE